MLMLIFKLERYNRSLILLKIYFQLLKKIKLIEKKEFITVVFDLENKTFIIYVAVLSVNSGDEVHPSKKA